MNRGRFRFSLRSVLLGVFSLCAVAPGLAQRLPDSSPPLCVPTVMSAGFPDFATEGAQTVLEARYCNGKEIMCVITRAGVLLRFDRDHMPTNLDEFIPWINAAPIHDLADIPC